MLERPEHDEHDAFAPATDAPREEEWWTVETPKEARDRARSQRVEDGGLPVDDATLDRVVAHHRSEDNRLPGLYLTPEEAEDEVPEDVMAAVNAYFGRHSGARGGVRLGYVDGRRVVLVAVTEDGHDAALAAIDPTRVVVERSRYSQAFLEQLAERVSSDFEYLRAAGIDTCMTGPDADFVELAAVAADPDAARLLVAERYGAAVRFVWLGPSHTRSEPREFRSWSSEETTLLVFYGIDFNGEVGEGAALHERDDEVRVTALIGQPVGFKTCMGGYQLCQAELTLARPLAGRPVVDATTGERRPSLAELRQQRAGTQP